MQGGQQQVFGEKRGMSALYTSFRYFWRRTSSQHTLLLEGNVRSADICQVAVGVGVGWGEVGGYVRYAHILQIFQE
jgi:hypothetical protein